MAIKFCASNPGSHLQLFLRTIPIEIFMMRLHKKSNFILKLVNKILIGMPHCCLVLNHISLKFNRKKTFSPPPIFCLPLFFQNKGTGAFVPLFPCSLLLLHISAPILCFMYLLLCIMSTMLQRLNNINFLFMMFRRSEGVQAARVLAPIPKHAMLWTKGFPTKV